MKKLWRTLVMVLVGVSVLSGCSLESFEQAPGSDIDNIEENKIDGVDFREDIQGEDGTYYSFNG